MFLLLALILAAQSDDLAELKKLYEAAKDKTVAERCFILDDVADLRTDAAAGFLTQVFDGDAAAAVREHVIDALAVCGTENAYAKLEEIATDPGRPMSFRSRALRAAATSKSDAAFRLVRKCTKIGNINDPLRRAGFRALLEFPLATTEEAWREALKDGDSAVRGWALRALAPLKDEKVESAARMALIDPNEAPAVKIGAVEVWRVKGDARA
ncbi:MAG: HEAT repeat domain-containing protein, partial [Planctomycetota bacterium]